MTRDGLVEKSALSKEERKISSRTADFSLDKKKPRQKTQESKNKSPKGKTQKQRDFSGNLREETISPYEALEQQVAAEAEEEERRKRRFYRRKGRHSSILIRRTKRQEEEHLFAVPVLYRTILFSGGEAIL